MVFFQGEGGGGGGGGLFVFPLYFKSNLCNINIPTQFLEAATGVAL